MRASARQKSANRSTNRIFMRELGFEVSVGMNVDHHRQPLIENHLHRGVEVAKIVGRNFVGCPCRNIGAGSTLSRT